MSSLFKKLSQGGGFSLPFLLHLYSDSRDVFLINANRPFTYKEVEFLPSTFTYIPHQNGDSTLEIELVDNGNQIINLFEEANNDGFSAEICGVLKEDGEVTEYSNFFHQFGSASWDGKSGEITFTKDWRLDCTFPALIFNAYNNRGNN